jgi:hypothetical protein
MSGDKRISKDLLYATHGPMRYVEPFHKDIENNQTTYEVESLKYEWEVLERNGRIVIRLLQSTQIEKYDTTHPGYHHLGERDHRRLMLTRIRLWKDLELLEEVHQQKDELEFGAIREGDQISREQIKARLEANLRENKLSEFQLGIVRGLLNSMADRVFEYLTQTEAEREGGDDENEDAGE